MITVRRVLIRYSQRVLLVLAAMAPSKINGSGKSSFLLESNPNSWKTAPGSVPQFLFLHNILEPEFDKEPESIVSREVRWEAGDPGFNEELKTKQVTLARSPAGDAGTSSGREDEEAAQKTETSSKGGASGVRGSGHEKLEKPLDNTGLQLSFEHVIAEKPDARAKCKAFWAYVSNFPEFAVMMAYGNPKKSQAGEAATSTFRSSGYGEGMSEISSPPMSRVSESDRLRDRPWQRRLAALQAMGLDRIAASAEWRGDMAVMPAPEGWPRLLMPLCDEHGEPMPPVLLRSAAHELETYQGARRRLMARVNLLRDVRTLPRPPPLPGPATVPYDEQIYRVMPQIRLPPPDEDQEALPEQRVQCGAGPCPVTPCYSDVCVPCALKPQQPERRSLRQQQTQPPPPPGFAEGRQRPERPSASKRRTRSDSQPKSSEVGGEPGVDMGVTAHRVCDCCGCYPCCRAASRPVPCPEEHREVGTRSVAVGQSDDDFRLYASRAKGSAAIIAASIAAAVSENAMQFAHQKSEMNRLSALATTSSGALAGARDSASAGAGADSAAGSFRDARHTQPAIADGKGSTQSTSSAGYGIANLARGSVGYDAADASSAHSRRPKATGARMMMPASSTSAGSMEGLVAGPTLVDDLPVDPTRSLLLDILKPRSERPAPPPLPSESAPPSSFGLRIGPVAEEEEEEAGEEEPLSTPPEQGVMPGLFATPEGGPSVSGAVAHLWPQGPPGSAPPSQYVLPTPCWGIRPSSMPVQRPSLSSFVTPTPPPDERGTRVTFKASILSPRPELLEGQYVGPSSQKSPHALWSEKLCHQPPQPLGPPTTGEWALSWAATGHRGGQRGGGVRQLEPGTLLVPPPPGAAFTSVGLPGGGRIVLLSEPMTEEKHNSPYTMTSRRLSTQPLPQGDDDSLASLNILEYEKTLRRHTSHARSRPISRPPSGQNKKTRVVKSERLRHRPRSKEPAKSPARGGRPSGAKPGRLDRAEPPSTAALTRSNASQGPATSSRATRTPARAITADASSTSSKRPPRFLRPVPQTS